ncbi:MAG: hypothetical protein AAF525_21730, partial [Pseudomonadota bacterium]
MSHHPFMDTHSRQSLHTDQFRPDAGLTKHQQGARIGQIATVGLAMLLHQAMIWCAWLLDVVSVEPAQLGMLTIGGALMLLVLVTAVLLEWNLLM